MNRNRLFCPAQAELAASRKSVVLVPALLFMNLALAVFLPLQGGASREAALPAAETAAQTRSSAGHVTGLFPQREHLSSFSAALEAMKAAPLGTRIDLPGWVIAEWYGGKAMDTAELRRTLDYVTKVLYPDGRWSTSEVLNLLLETAAVETAMGEIVRQKNGPALSVWQILGFNFEEIREYFGKRDPLLLERAMAFYNHDYPEDWNRIHNVPWTAAMSLLYYEKATQGKFMTRLSSLDSRGRLWKQIYNTPLGKGTVQRYKQRAREYVHLEVETS